MAHTATGRVLEDTPRNADKVGPAMRESFDHLPRMSMGEMNAAAGSKDRPLRLWLLSASSQQGVTFYRIAGRFTTNGQTWEVNRRYSEFLALRDKLVKFLSTSPDTCPGCEHYLHALKLFAFPKKHFIASRTPLVVNYRVKALRAFVNLLASWTFSTSPKCPTCGGYAFDIVRNFFVDTAAPLTGSDMDYIRESIVVEAFSGSGERSSGLTRRNSWIPASASTTLQQQEQQRMTQSARNIAPQRHSMMEQPIQSQRQAQSQRHTMMEHPSQAPRSSQGYRPSQSQRSGQPQSSRGSVSSTRKSMPRIASAPPARPAQPDRRTNMINDAAYDMFNDYLPERPAHLKKPAHKNTEGGGDNAKFSALSLAEEARLREQQLEKQRSTLSSTGSGKLQGYPEKPSQTYSRGSSSAASGSRSDPRQRAQSAPRDSYQHSAHGQSGSSRGAGNGPNVQRAARGQPAPMFDSFLSESSTGSMAAEPVFVHGDELRRYGIAASSDEEGKFDTSEDEIDITGVALASPPRSRRKTTSGDNLWQPWELAKVA